MGLAVSLFAAAFGCNDANNAPDGGMGATGRGGGSGPTTGTGGAMNGSGPTTGTGGSIGGGRGGSAPSAGAGGAGGAAGAAGTGAGGTGGAVCTGDPLTRCDGTMSGAWCSERLAAGSQPFFSSIWSDRPDDVWFVGGDLASGGTTSSGSGVLAHFDGCAWTVMQRQDLPNISGVWGSAPNDVWFVGASGNAYHWDGSALTAAAVPGATSLGSVSGTSGTDVWAVGTGLFHWNGSAWTQSSSMSGDDVWAVAPDDVWVATGTTDVLHFDGTTWTATTLTDFGLFSVWGDATQAYAAGEGEAIFHFTGGSWTTLQGRGGSSEGFVDIGGLGTDIFTVGNNKVVRLSGNTFTQVTDVPPASYRSVWVSPNQIWLGASNGGVAHRAR